MEAKSIYDIKVQKMDGSSLSLSEYKGKVLLIVNTASKCGFTKQFGELQELYDKYSKEGLVILGFPANNFMNQDPGTNEEILDFCQLNYGVSFPMLAKISVRGKDIDPLYKYLTEKSTNKDFAGKITWNFNKFLIGKDGKILARYSSQTKPMAEEVIADLEAALAK
jgi:glutathione peroxidase